MVFESVANKGEEIENHAGGQHLEEWKQMACKIGREREVGKISGPLFSKTGGS
jgi:hypothetical protein